jgi:glycosyltransferase involved in cell wall biosynthesis
MTLAVPTCAQLSLSIVVPTYNRRSQVFELAHNILSSSYEQFELIVVDDGSSDQTFEALSEINDNRLNVFRIANSERGKARNFGAQQAKGEYINFFDSDDLPYPHHTEALRETIHPGFLPEWVVFGYQIRDPSGRVLRSRVPKASKPFMRVLSIGNPFPPNSVFIRRDIALLNPFHEGRALAGSEDYELWLRLSMQYEPLYLPRLSTYALCQWPGRSVNNISASKASAQYQALLDAINRLSWPIQLLSYKKSAIAGIKTYFSLLLSSSSKHKLESLVILLHALFLAPKLLMTKRPYAVVKSLLFRRNP